MLPFTIYPFFFRKEREFYHDPPGAHKKGATLRPVVVPWTKIIYWKPPPPDVEIISQLIRDKVKQMAERYYFNFNFKFFFLTVNVLCILIFSLSQD